MDPQADAGSARWRDAGNSLQRVVFLAGLIALTGCGIAGLIEAVALQGGLPMGSMAYQRFANAQRSAGDLEAAIAEYRGEQRVNRNPTGSGMALYQLLVEVGRVDEALEALRLSIQRTTRWTSHTAYAEKLAAAGRWQEAEVVFQRAAQLDPKNAVLRVQLGQFLEAAGHYGDAVDAYQSAIDLDPELSEARFRQREARRRAQGADDTRSGDTSGMHPR